MTDSRVPTSSLKALRHQAPPAVPTVGSEYATVAWAGLESFTGEYRFQIEFPGETGRVISRLIHAARRSDGGADVYCPEDEQTRRMQYRFYTANGMFRLNVPNDTPGVVWARSNHQGIALVEPGLPGGRGLRLTILRPGSDLEDVVGHSVALGTWDRTSTRAYGWY